MLTKLMTEHPASVGETYWQYMGMAFSFAGALFIAAIACAIHAVFPFLCVKTGSQAINALHHRMVNHRDQRPSEPRVALRA